MQCEQLPRMHCWCVRSGSSPRPYNSFKREEAIDVPDIMSDRQRCSSPHIVCVTYREVSSLGTPQPELRRHHLVRRLLSARGLALL